MRDQPPSLHVGSEFWLLHFDSTGPRWIPLCYGVVERVDQERGYFVRVRRDACEWFGASVWPAFGSKAEAEEYARAHPPQVPTIT